MWYASRRWPAFRALPPQLKALGVVLIVAPTYAIQSERRGVEYDESTWTGAGKALLDDKERKEETRWDALNSKEKIKDWAMRNQYKVIVGSWAASMAIAATIVMRNRCVLRSSNAPLRRGQLTRSHVATRPLPKRSCRPVCGPRASPSAS